MYPVSSRDLETRMVSCPSHLHGNRKRVNALLRTGACNSARDQVAPPSVETSTCSMRPRPDQAKPEISVQPRPSTYWPPEGEVMTELASISKLKERALPSGMRSV